MSGRVFIAAVTLLVVGSIPAAELWIGAAEADITPEKPVALDGNTTAPISRSVKSPIKAAVLVIESREAGKARDGAILISCDLVRIRPGVQDGFRKHVAPRLPGFDVSKLFLAATHTHTAPVTDPAEYADYGDAMPPGEYVKFMYDRLADAVVQAWESRQSGTLAWGLGHAVVAQSRRMVYKNGSAAMYGKTNRADFRKLESDVDHAVDALFLLDSDKKLKAAVVVVPTPSQSEGGSRVGADYWHYVRAGIREKHGQSVIVVGFIAPAGNQTPRVMLRKKAESRMRKLKGVSRSQEVAGRIVRAVDEVWDVALKDIRTDLSFAHRVERFEVPGRKITEKEYAQAKKRYDALAAKAKLVGGDYWEKRRFGSTLARYKAQQSADPLYSVEMHVIRLSDVVIASNPFEMYPEYGTRIQARSPAVQTVLISFASSLKAAGYLATREAERAGGYSALVESCPVGPEGGQIFVDKSVHVINAMFDNKQNH